MTVRNDLLGGTDLTDGEVLYAADANDTFNATIFNTFLMPIGSIIAWHKSFTNTPSLPDRWVECNGQVLSDVESVYNGQTIPDLNGSLGSGLKGRFLRGHSESGLTESSQNLAHTHTYDMETAGYYGSSGKPNEADERVGGTTGTTNSSGGTEARPFNFSVVWIMRIK